MHRLSPNIGANLLASGTNRIQTLHYAHGLPRKNDLRNRVFWSEPDSELAVVSSADSAGESEADRRRRVEAILLLSREPLNTRRVSQLAGLADATEARTLIRRLNDRYDQDGRAFRVEEVAGGFLMLTRPQFAPWLRRLGYVPQEERLTQPALETLAVVAYRQPVQRADIEAIRGVGCDEVLKQLILRDLVRICGRSEDLGRPYLYGTTKRFLQLFGLKTIDRLPRTAWNNESWQPQPTDSETAKPEDEPFSIPIRQPTLENQQLTDKTQHGSDAKESIVKLATTAFQIALGSEDLLDERLGVASSLDIRSDIDEEDDEEFEDDDADDDDDDEDFDDEDEEFEDEEFEDDEDLEEDEEFDEEFDDEEEEEEGEEEFAEEDEEDEWEEVDDEEEDEEEWDDEEDGDDDWDDDEDGEEEEEEEEGDWE